MRSATRTRRSGTSNHGPSERAAVARQHGSRPGGRCRAIRSPRATLAPPEGANAARRADQSPPHPTRKPRAALERPSDRLAPPERPPGPLRDRRWLVRALRASRRVREARRGQLVARVGVGSHVGGSAYGLSWFLGGVEVARFSGLGGARRTRFAGRKFASRYPLRGGTVSAYGVILFSGALVLRPNRVLFEPALSVLRRP